MATGTRYIANRNHLVQDFVNTALKNRFWIYQSAGKKWYTPEEFSSQYEAGTLDLKEDWLKQYRIMNPQRGLAAAEIIMQDLLKKRNEFQLRVIEYYQHK